MPKPHAVPWRNRQGSSPSSRRYSKYFRPAPPLPCPPEPEFRNRPYAYSFAIACSCLPLTVVWLKLRRDNSESVQLVLRFVGICCGGRGDLQKQEARSLHSFVWPSDNR